MKRKIVIALVALLAVALILLAMFNAGYRYREGLIQPLVPDTVRLERTDTCWLPSPPDTVTKTEYKTVLVPAGDVEIDTDVDSARVTLLFDQHHAQLEDVADIWYSGYQAKIDSARVYKTTVTEIIRQPYEVMVPKNPLLTLDVGIGNHEWKSLDPYVFARATINADKWKIEPYVGYTYSKQPMFGVSVSRSFTLIK